MSHIQQVNIAGLAPLCITTKKNCSLYNEQNTYILKTIFNFNELELVLFTRSRSMYIYFVHESTNCFCLYFFFVEEKNNIEKKEEKKSILTVNKRKISEGSMSTHEK